MTTPRTPAIRIPDVEELKRIYRISDTTEAANMSSALQFVLQHDEPRVTHELIKDVQYRVVNGNPLRSTGKAYVRPVYNGMETLERGPNDTVAPLWVNQEAENTMYMPIFQARDATADVDCDEAMEGAANFYILFVSLQPFESPSCERTAWIILCWLLRHHVPYAILAGAPSREDFQVYRQENGDAKLLENAGEDRESNEMVLFGCYVQLRLENAKAALRNAADQ